MTADLTTRYLGLELPTPVVASSSPVTGDLDRLVAAVEAGAGAVVLPSIFEEEVEAEEMAVHQGLEAGAGIFGEASEGYLPEPVGYEPSIERQLDHLRSAVASVDVPVIGSLNGVSPGGWVRYATRLVDAGSAAIELNLYRMPSDPDESGAEVEAEYLSLVETVREAVDVPLAVKIGPWFSSLPSMARRFRDAGVDGLVLFNRFYQPDIDLETMGVSPNLVLSDPSEARQVLRWIGVLRPDFDGSLAATSGVHGPDDAAKLLLAGADIVMMASALLRHGPGHVATVVEGLRSWLTEQGYESADQARGSMSQANVADPDAFARANYIATLHSWG
jgi:dihydroorotate dehydrogenase (fumarate)